MLKRFKSLFKDRNGAQIEELRRSALSGFIKFARTDEGQLFLNYLDTTYCEASCISDKPEITYANLANKELVEHLIRLATNHENLGEHQ